VVSDRNDTPVVLDIKTATLRQLRSGRLRLEVDTFNSWANSVLLPSGSSGPPGSICLRLWLTRSPGGRPPSYLVCVTARASGRTLRATILRERAGPPARVGAAAVDRPSGNAVRVAFSPQRIGSPKSLRFGVEATQVAGCPRPRGCVDRAPNGARTRAFALRP
jgi:hypothetical protein